MSGVKNSKLKLLVLADILEKQTDEEHTFTANELCDKLRKEDIQICKECHYCDTENCADKHPDKAPIRIEAKTIGQHTRYIRQHTSISHN